MKPSDFLTILTIAVAVWAIIPKKERSFILLFFSKMQLVVFGLSFLYIHFLMSFDWLQKNWAEWLVIFTSKKGLPAETWAYIIALIAISLPIIKVSFGYFSKHKLEEVIKLYKQLINEKEFDLLVQYITKFHIQDVHFYLTSKSLLTVSNFRESYNKTKTQEEIAFEKVANQKRIKLASWVYYNVIQDEAFVRGAANKYPELFAKAISGICSKRTSNQDFVKLYVECLFNSKNIYLINELKAATDAHDSIAERINHIQLPILAALFVNTEAASENYVWYPVGKSVEKSLHYDIEQKNFLISKYDHRLEPELWDYKIHIGIIYFEYMVRETIYKDGGWHMWLHYYQYFIENLIELIPDDNEYEEESTHPSFAHYFIDKMMSIMYDWIDLARELENDNRVIDTIRCMGASISAICEASDSKLSFHFKRNQLEHIISLYFSLSKYPDNVGATTSREYLEKLFNNPKGVDFGTPETTDNYLMMLREAWKKFDKVPYQFLGNGGKVEKFETNILNPLGIN
jgi:hypothetical protein